MAKPTKLHSYSDVTAFERLLLLIATLVRSPGVGVVDDTHSTDVEHLGGHHDAMVNVLLEMRRTAQRLGIDWSDCSVHTLRKDLRTLRRYGLLESRLYRWECDQILMLSTESLHPL
jgi:hypothetical protein